MQLSKIDLSRTELPLVAQLIRHQMASGMTSFSDLVSTAPDESEIDSFRVVEDAFEINQSVDKVFDHYLTVNPSEAWSGGKLVKFGLALDKNTGDVYYPNDPYPGAAEGHVLYIHLDIWGLKKICMAQEIVRIDYSKKIIIFSYVKGGMTSGMQVMAFSSIDRNRTHILHTSFYKGVSAFRDKFLYPYFHSLVVKEFHSNMMNIMEY